MEKHRCKLCFRSFSNGRALGGHMRSHMMTLPVPPKREEEDPPPPPPPPATSPAPVELNEEADSASSSSSSSEDEDEGKEAYYGLRENPKRSIKLVDPEFSFAVAVDAGSVVLQDRESETESSKNPTRRRSKRSRKSSSSNSNSDHDHHHHRRHHYIQLVQNSSPSPDKKIKSSELSEQVSSVVSDATTDEDIAFCLMMLSRDNWNRENDEREENEEEDDYEEVGDDEEEEESENHEESDEEITTKNWKSNNNNSNSRTKRTGKYKCDTCNKVFRSYQALGGHRASHKKIKQQILTSPVTDVIDETRELLRANAGTVAIAQQVKKKIHECPVCFRVFSSGQALGGHKRSHVITGNSAPIQQPKLIASFSDNNNNDNNPSFAAATITTKKSLSKIGDHQISLIDLNLPAPDDDEDEDEDDQDHDDDEISQIELSAVSDAEFVNSISHPQGS